MGASNQLLEAKNLYVARGSNPVLRDVSVSVGRGETVAVLGGNGSGKSTLVNAVLGLLAHQQGTVELFGTSLRQFHSWERIGYVPQHSSIQVAAATVREVVASGRIPHHRPFFPLSKADKAAIDHALDVVNLQDRAHWPFASLSGGQKQRALIARALCTEPDLFVMDEPMAGVDLHSQHGLATLLGSLVHANDKGLLVVLHEIGAMEIDRRITLCDGRITHDDHLTLHSHHASHDSDEAPSPFGLESPTAEAQS